MGNLRVNSSRSILGGSSEHLNLRNLLLLFLVLLSVSVAHPIPQTTVDDGGEICWDVHVHAHAHTGLEDAKTRVKRDVPGSESEESVEIAEAKSTEEPELETTTVRDERLQEAIDIISRLFPNRCRSIRNKFLHPTDCTKFVTCADIKGDGNLNELEVDCPPGEMYDDTLMGLESSTGEPAPQTGGGGSGGGAHLHMHLQGCVNPTSMSPKARCFPEVQKLLNEVDLTSGDLNNGSSTASPIDALTPSYVYGLLSANPEIAVAICILLFILLISICFLCCYLLRIMYECAFTKPPAKGCRSRMGSGRQESRSGSRSTGGSHRSSGNSRSLSKKSTSKPESPAVSFRRFLDHNDRRVAYGDGDSIELKSVTFLRSDSGFPSPPAASDERAPRECSTLEIQGPRTQKHVELQSAYAWPWQVESNTETSTQVIVPCAGGYEPRITTANAVTASSSSTTVAPAGRSNFRKKVEIYIPNLNIPNALEPYHVKTLFEEGGVDEDYFGVMESKPVEGYEGFGEDDEGYQIVPNLSPPPLYDAVIPRHQRNQSGHKEAVNIAPTRPGGGAEPDEGLPEPPSPPPPPPVSEAESENCSCGGDNDNPEPDPGEKRWSTFGKRIAVSTSGGGDGAPKKSSVIVLEPVDGVPGAGPDRVLEYFF